MYSCWFFIGIFFADSNRSNCTNTYSGNYHYYVMNGKLAFFYLYYFCSAHDNAHETQIHLSSACLTVTVDQLLMYDERYRYYYKKFRYKNIIDSIQ